MQQDKCIAIPQKTYNTTKRLKTPEDEAEHYFLDFIAFTDCTEQQQQQQQIPKPEDKIRCKAYAYYSGKKKRHTVKNQLVANNNGCIVHKLG